MHVYSKFTDMYKNLIKGTYVHWLTNICSPAHKACFVASRTYVLQKLLFLMVLMTLGVTNAWGQDYSGVYYIGSSRGYTMGSTNNYYLCPTEGWAFFVAPNSVQAGDNGQPFLTTYQCIDASMNYDATKAVWIVEKETNSGCYYIKQAKTGRYIVSNKVLTGAGNTRARVHLETVADADALTALGDLALFEITFDNTNASFPNHYDIIPHSTAGRDGNNKYLTVNTNNYNYLYGTNSKTNGPTGFKNCGGIIGLYTHPDDGNTCFYFETPQPTITNNFDDTFTITAATGATIYYTTDGTTPTTTHYTGTGTTSVSFPKTETMTVIKAIAKEANAYLSLLTTYNIPVCARPVITVSGGNVTITCVTEGVTIYYTTNGDPATTSSPNTYSTSFPKGSATTIRAIAVKTGYLQSNEAVYLPPKEVSSSSEIDDMVGNYILADNFTLSSSIGTSDNPFKGTIDGNMVTRDDLGAPLVAYADGATIKNVILKDVSLQNAGTNVGAICNEARGDSRIYNCGVLGTLTETKDANGNVTSISSSSNISGSGAVGSIVGLLDGTSRVINCFSFASVSGGSGTTGGIVGNNNQSSTMLAIKTIVVNCMFYGESSSGFPVYGGNVIENSGTNAINNYNYYREAALFDNNFSSLADYNRSWPAEERYLTRFEYYRSILNSNRRLCTWWVNGANGISPTDDDVADVGIAKWVLDPSIAPYPILKEWGKYPSIINPDPAQTWDPEANNGAGAWQARSTAAPHRGKSHGTLKVTVRTGSYPETLSGLSVKEETVYRIITEMDTLNHDYGYYKIQLPYYNEVFGTPDETDYLKRYWGNYTTNAVTGWKITSVNKSGANSFKAAWEDGYNYADRNCTEKDIYASNGGRAFAQGGYYYVPEGVTSIEIEAYWGKAFYLHGKDHALDRVNVTNSKNYGTAFTPAGTLDNTMPYGNISIYENFNTLMTAVKANKSCNVYDQAVVLVGNYPLHAQNDINMDNSCQGGFTIMSADFDMDNEPDFCFPFQWRGNTNRLPIMPIRFDFLPVPELGMVMRHNTYAYALGIFVPQGHFEITETAFMHTTQFEYMSYNVAHTTPQPLILNGGQFEQIVSNGNNKTPSTNDKTRNIILGGHVWMKRFSPGSHTNNHCYTRHCAVSVMGGDFPEFYLTGIYWTDVTTSNAYNDNPHCYTNGGRFGLMAGAGMEAVKNNVYFEIDHSVIDEFYGGGINSNNPVAGNIVVTINNSLVLEKYCGGPKVGSSGTVTTNAKGTVFNQYFGGGNGGTNLYRQQIKDLTPTDMPGTNDWNGTYGFNAFTPISNQGGTVTYNSNLGYHAEFEFEVFNQSNGVGKDAVARTYQHWAQFGTTTTGNVSNTLENCTVNHNFYGGGNLATVTGTVTSTLKGTTQVIGSAYGAGYSASVPKFAVHTKTGVAYPYRDGAGVCHNGSLQYLKDGSVVRQYTWCYKNPTTNVVTPAGVVIPDGVTTSKPAFQYEGKWYCYTTVSLENLGTVSGKTTLNIEGSTLVKGMEFDENGVVTAVQSGGVFGGGDASAALGDTEVKINATGQQTSVANYNTYNVYGGGNNAPVGGNTVVNLKDGVIENHVFGGGNQGKVTGSTTVNMEDGN